MDFTFKVFQIRQSYSPNASKVAGRKTCLPLLRPHSAHNNPDAVIERQKDEFKALNESTRVLVDTFSQETGIKY